MNVAARVQYPGAGASGMSPPNTKPIRPFQSSSSSSPRDYEFDERAALHHHYPKSTNAQFDSYDDFYAFLENNRSALQQDQTANAMAGIMPSQHSQMHLHQQQQQQQQLQQQQQQRQGMSGNQQLSGRPRAPSYSTGSQSEEMLVAKADAKKAAAHRQQTGRRPTKAPPSATSSGQGRPGSSSRGSEQLSPGKGRQHSSADGPPVSQSGANGAAAIQRLKTPSLMDSVLHPLDQKVREYGELMRREQEQMDRLDEELRVLHERRAEAEARFLEAKGKHDDFRRRHEDVERAMRGEPPLPREPMPPQQQQQQQGSLVPPPLQHQQRPPPQQAPVQDRFPRPQSMALPPPHDYDDDVSEVSSDEEERHRPGDRRVQSQHSFGKPPPPQQQQKRRFRMSLFG